MRKTNSQNRRDRIKKREFYIRSNSKGISNWSNLHIVNTMERHGIENYEIRDNDQAVLITSGFSHWHITHDNKVVTLRHMNKATYDNSNKLRGAYHKQDVFFTLNQSINYILDHDDYKELK